MRNGTKDQHQAVNYIISHFFCRLVVGASVNAATMACVSGIYRGESTSSNTFFRPFCVRAEHSTYLTAPSSLANLSPCSKLMGLVLFRASLSSVTGSSRKSTIVPVVSRHTREGRTHDDAGGRRTMMSDFRKPLFLHVLKGGRRSHVETD